MSLHEVCIAKFMDCDVFVLLGIPQIGETEQCDRDEKRDEACGTNGF